MLRTRRRRIELVEMLQLRRRKTSMRGWVLLVLRRLIDFLWGISLGFVKKITWRMVLRYSELSMSRKEAYPTILSSLHCVIFFAIDIVPEPQHMPYIHESISRSRKAAHPINLAIEILCDYSDHTTRTCLELAPP